MSTCCATFATEDKRYEPMFHFSIKGLIFPFKRIGSPRARSKTINSLVSLIKLWELGVNEMFCETHFRERTFQATANAENGPFVKITSRVFKWPLCVQWRAVFASRGIR